MEKDRLRDTDQYFIFSQKAREKRASCFGCKCKAISTKETPFLFFIGLQDHVFDPVSLLFFVII